VRRFNGSTAGGSPVSPGRGTANIRLTYAYVRTETDAVLSVLSYSDLGRSGGTNAMGHIVGQDYVLMPRLTLSVKNHFINFINRPSGFHNPTLSRLQVDAVLSF
jgi:hypothetical protein